MELNALFVKNAPPGKYEDGNGLRLVKRVDGGGQWVFRYTVLGRRREMGIGGLTAVSLKDARDHVGIPVDGRSGYRPDRAEKEETARCHQSAQGAD